MSNPRRLSLPYQVGTPVRYVGGTIDAPYGIKMDPSDDNDGLSAAYPKATLYGAIQSIQQPPGTVGTTIYVMGAAYIGGPLPGQGLRLGDGGNASFPGWLPTNELRIIGLGGSFRNNESNVQAELLPGTSGDGGWTGPDRQDVGIWITANGFPVYMENICVRKFGIPLRLGVSGNPGNDPDNTLYRGTAQTVSNLNFKNCTFKTPDSYAGKDQGPAADLGFLVTFNNMFDDCGFNIGDVRVGGGDLTSYRRAAVLVNPGDGSSILTMRDCHGFQGGIIYVVGATDFIVDIDGFLTESSGATDLPSIVKVVGLGPYGSIATHRIVGADAPNTPWLCENSGMVGPYFGNWINTSGGRLENLGAMTLVAPAGTMSQSPYGQGQIGFAQKAIFGDIDAVRANGPVITNRLYNMCPQKDGSQGIVGNIINPPDVGTHSSNRVWTQTGATGSGTVNSAIADRNGGTTAIRINGNDANPVNQSLFQVVQNCTAGDTWVAGMWFRSKVNLNPGPAVVTVSGITGGATFTSQANLRPNWNVGADAGTGNDGDWQWVSGAITCLSGSGTAQFNYTLSIGGNQQVDLDKNFVFVKLPTGSYTINDIGFIKQSMVQYTQAPLGAASTQPSQMLIAQGGLGVGNAVSATTPGSVVKKIQIFDASGNSLGFIPVYSTIT